MKNIKILYEDKDILAIDKPSGIAAHADGRSKEKTIADWILKKYPRLKDVGEKVTFDEKEIPRPGIVHRLDKETSGVLLIMKTPSAFAYFKKQFMDRKIKKVYNAVVSGWVKNDRGVIDKPIGRSPADFRRRLAGRGARGELKQAVTEYKVLKRLEAPAPSLDKFSYLEVRPKTGRTHQIRVHMKYLNHPVAGDALYNPKDKNWPRMMLHAKSIEFKTPSGKTAKIESPLPKEFKEFA
ncbi:MAG TPA: RluA family pseudouridine synthase [Candidatus Paceibacterota bacterium]|nr:RluA family pseudouridine synthase [Candidatus Paceibacterota bacterium]